MATIFKFKSSVDLTEVRGCLILAATACEAIYGESAVRLEAKHSFDPQLRCASIQSDSECGRALVRVLHDYCLREFGEHSFEIEPHRSGMNPHNLHA
jgi:hypothetical protein